MEIDIRVINKIIIQVFLFTGLTSGQLSMPRISQRAEVSQTIGLSKITVNYSRPGVKGREIWGKLVPYGLSKNSIGLKNEIPWRAGADENTTISFSHDVKINRENLSAGRFGLQVIPEENDDWVIIFSKDNSAWGSFFYEQKNDALRIKVKPEIADMQEWLEYSIENITENSCDVFLKWEKKAIHFNVSFDIHKIVTDSLKQQLKGIAGFNWQSWNQAAAYCLQINEYLETGLEWCKTSIMLNENANNRNLLGYLLLAKGNDKDALIEFEENTKKFPSNWNVFDSYAEVLQKNGRKDESIKNYQKAFDLAPENQKMRIKNIIDSINTN
ncbi:MAG: hypothetical protein CO129_02865 [Ignavibacteriales bacterium CG_4_9_14_3_um_filter_34_10]|nr:MAG: hypothetical protein CO129_02865 [Ignavibacteriales bacterium CG_4_9_14_3_um_filter_34_10]